MINQWQIMRLDEVLQLHIDAVPVDPTQYYKISGVYSFGRGLLAREALAGSETTYRVFHRLHENDYVLSQVKGWEGALARVTAEFDGWFLSPQYPTFRAIPDKLEIRYLEWYCRQSFVWEEHRRKSRGIGARRETVTPRDLLSLEIPLPPLDEQRRIVAHIDALAARIAEARGLRLGAVEEAEAILASARNALFDPVFFTAYPTRNLGSISELQSGVTLGRDLTGSTIKLPYLRVANVQDGYLDLSEVKEVEIRESEFDKWQLQPGDLLLTEGGDWDKLGRGAVWNGEISDCIHQNHVFRIRVNPDEFDPRYLIALISSPYGKSYFQEASKQTTNLASINQRQLKAFIVTQPPLDEQRRIVAYLDDLQARVDALKWLQQKTAAELDALLPSVLDRAFKGEL